MAISNENLPAKLLQRQMDTLDLPHPLYIEGEEALFAHLAAPAQSAVIFLPKSKALIDMTLALASGMVVENGTVLLIGTKKAGIESSKLAYEIHIGPVEEKRVGNHSAMYVGKNKRLSAAKKLADFMKAVPVELADTKITIASLPGVFSDGKLDAGTKLLLQNIPYDKKNVLDMGCGAGVVGAFYKARFPESSVTFSDASMLALAATKETLRLNKIEGTVVLSDVFANIKGEFDLILCNPPFHSGINTDYSFIDKLSADAKKHLAPGGWIYIVCNSFLTYERTFEKAFGAIELVANDGRFKVLKARR